MQQSPWTEERLAKLRELGPLGLTGESIAAQIGGVTRNAVNRKLMRLGIDRSQHKGDLAESERKKNKPVNGHRRRHDGKPTLKVIEEFRPRTVDVESKRKTIVELEAQECRYPDPEGNPDAGIPHTFCGNVTEIACPYCPAHRALTVGQGTPAERAAVPRRYYAEKAA